MYEEGVKVHGCLGWLGCQLIDGEILMTSLTLY